MNRESLRRLSALLPLLLYAAAICGGSSGPAPDSIVALNVPDALLHGAEFAVFGFLAARWVRGETLKTGLAALVVFPTLLTVAYGATDEIHQSFVPLRTPDFVDLLSDAGGGLLGAGAYFLFAFRRRGTPAATAAALLLLGLPAPVAAEPPAAALASVRDADVRADAAFLASHAMRGRSSPSAELDVAARYIAERFRAAGLEALGADFRVPVPLRFRVERGDSFVRAGNASFAGRDVAVVAAGPDGDGAGPVLFAGFGLSGPEGDDFAGSDARGRVVVAFEGLPLRLEERGRGDPDLLARASVEGKMRTAAAKGAVALVLVRGPRAGTVDRLTLADGRALEGRVDETAGGYRVTMAGFRRVELPPGGIAKVVLRDGRELRPASDAGLPAVALPVAEETIFVPASEVAGPPERGVVPLPRPDPGLSFLPAGKPPDTGIPTARVSARVAEALLGTSLAAAEQSAERADRPPAADGSAAVLRARTRVEERPAWNVAAIRRGRDEGAPVFLAIAHYDHLGTGPDGEVYAGADDNASGTAALLAIADALGRLPEAPAATVGVVAMAAEELGLVGSRAFTDAPPFPLAKIGAVINMDMVGRGDAGEVVVVSAPLGTGLADALAAGAAAAGLRAQATVLPPPKEGPPPVAEREKTDLPAPEGTGPWFPRSDHMSFYRKGIPVAFLFGAMHEDYNRPTDTPEKLSVEKITKVARLALHALLAMAGGGAGG